MRFCDTSIKRKLTLILMATSTFAVLVACILFYYLVVQHFERTYRKDLSTLTSIVGSNCQVALAFNVPEDATRLLASVKGRKSIMAVRIYDKDKRIFAIYNNAKLAALPISSREKFLKKSNFLEISQDIVLDDGVKIGSISVYDDLRDIEYSKRKGLYILTATSIFSLLFAFFLASFLKDIIYKPISILTEAVKRLAADDFAVTQSITINSHDEIGVLFKAFTEMSDRLQESYIKLKSHSQNLEKEVDERTMELSKALDKLTRSQQQLVQSEKLAAIGRMVAGIAHEINNSINFVSGTIPILQTHANDLRQILTDNSSSSQVQQNASDKIINHIGRLLGNASEGVDRTIKLVSDLNSFAQPSRGHLTTVNLHQEIDTAALLLQYEFNDRITLHRDYDDKIPPVECLKDQMNQVYTNILLNASQAISGQGEIWIKTRISNNMVRISIRDNGDGIRAEVRDKIFEPFFTTKQVGKGTGLGLSIAYGIVKSHNGQISIEQTSQAGTIFTITIPLKQDSNADIKTYTTGLLNTKNCGGKT